MRPDYCLEMRLRALALRRLPAVVAEPDRVGDYQWDCGERRFTLGFFRGIAGVGYTLLRRLFPAIPNALIWD
jgi:lantibiotic modifying enzyme